MTKLSLAMLATLTSACVARTGFGIEPIAPVAVIGASPDGPPPPPPPAGAPAAGPEAPAPAPAATIPGTPAVAQTAGGKYAPGEDAHWLQADDYLVSIDAKKKKESTWLTVGKMIGSASDSSKGEAHFLLGTGAEQWAAVYYRTRIATRADLKVGATVICFTSWAWHDGRAPESKHESRTGHNDPGWMMAVVTDNADLYKGKVTVGDKSCAVDAVRIAVE